MRRHVVLNFIAVASALLMGFLIASCERTETSDVPKNNERSHAEEDANRIAPIHGDNLNEKQNPANLSKDIGSTNGVYARITDNQTGDYAILNSSNVLTLSDQTGNTIQSVNIGKFMGPSRFISMSFYQSNILVEVTGRRTIFVNRQNGKTSYTDE